MINSQVLIYAYAAEISAAEGLKYKGSATDRCELTHFLLNNEWFQGDRTEKDLCIPWDEKREEGLLFWLEAYGLSNKERFDLLVQKGANTIPAVCQAFSSFAEEKSCSWNTRVCILDFLVKSGTDDLFTQSQEDVELLLVESNQFLNFSHRKLLAEFISSLHAPGVTPEFRYKAVKNTPYAMNNDAYSLEEFAHMGSCLFGDNSWTRNRLREKALVSKKIATILATLALFFFTALRHMDMLRLPKPRLSLLGEDFSKALVSGTMSKTDLVVLVETWELEIASFHRVPGKTAGCREDPDIKVLVPVSLKEPLGHILALCAFHYGDGEEGWLYKGRITQKDLDGIFDVVKWPKVGRSFCYRRANKAFLQGIQLVCKDGAIDAYVGTALFRGHSATLGSLPPTTSIYLKDHQFSGMTSPKFLHQLFERGTLSFVLTLLLERVDKETYRAIPMEGQTQLIQSLDLEPVSAENVALSVNQAWNRAKRTVSDILTGDDTGSIKEKAQSVLEAITNGASPAKQDHLCCVRIAAGQACPYQGRSSCLGCGAEVYTRSAFHLLVQEYVLLAGKIKKAKGKEMMRLTRILEDGALSAMIQFCESARILHQDRLMNYYLTILERAKQHVRNQRDL